MFALELREELETGKLTFSKSESKIGGIRYGLAKYKNPERKPTSTYECETHWCGWRRHVRNQRFDTARRRVKVWKKQ